MLCFHLSGTLATLVAKQPTIPYLTCLAIFPLLQVNVFKAPLTKEFFQNYWWSHNWQGPYNVNMVVAIFLLMYMTSILLLIQEFSTFLLRKRGITSRRPFLFHDAKNNSHVLFCDNCTAFSLRYVLICASFPLLNRFICFLNIMRVHITENRYKPPVQLVLCTSHVWMTIFT